MHKGTTIYTKKYKQHCIISIYEGINSFYQAVFIDS
jgi:hypothetical protein